MRLKKKELTELTIALHQAISTQINWITLRELATRLNYQNNLTGLARLVRKYYVVTGKGAGAQVYPVKFSCQTEKKWKPKPIDLDHQNGNTPTQLIRRLIRVVERQDQELAACRQEIARLNRVKDVPTLSDRVKRALATYGD